MTKQIDSSRRGWIAGLLAALASVAAGGSTARADVVRYDFAGTVILAEEMGDVQVGDPIRGTFAYDPASPAGPYPFHGTGYLGEIELHFTPGSRAFGGGWRTADLLNVSHFVPPEPPPGLDWKV